MKKKLISTNLSALQGEKGNICVSLILPTHSLAPDRKMDAQELDKIIKRAVETVEYEYGHDKSGKIAEQLELLKEEIDFNRNKEGLGLYVSADLKLKVQFPFPVKEKVIVSDRFEIRELLYQDSFSETYFVLLFSEDQAKLFQGSWNELSEINDGRFPLTYEEEFLYNPPSRGSSVGGHANVKCVEKERSVLEEIRHTDLLRKVDVFLGNYLTSRTPLIIAAPVKELSWFEKITRFSINIIGKIKGNYFHHRPDQIGALVWPLMFEHLQLERKLMLREFEELVGQHRSVSGIQESWRAAKEGRGLKLLIEKDYRIPGFVDSDSLHLFLHPPAIHHKTIPDAADELMETVLEKNGQVFLTDNDLLKNYQHVAMITRY